MPKALDVEHDTIAQASRGDVEYRDLAIIVWTGAAPVLLPARAARHSLRTAAVRSMRFRNILGHSLKRQSLDIDGC